MEADLTDEPNTVDHDTCCDMAFRAAIRNNRLSIVEFFVAMGIDVQDHIGYAVLTAANYGHSKVLRFLMRETQVEIPEYLKVLMKSL